MSSSTSLAALQSLQQQQSQLYSETLSEIQQLLKQCTDIKGNKVMQ